MTTKLKVFLSAVIGLLSLPITAQEPLPFSENFSTEAGFNRFTVINANNDITTVDLDGSGAEEVPCTWEFDINRLCASYTYNKADQTQGADDWLITPGFELEAGRTYTLQFLVGCANAQGERLEVKIGKSATVDGQTGTILPATDITDKLNFDDALGKVYTFDNISVTEAGIYYIGFHAISPANHFRLMLDNVEVKANPLLSAPTAVTNLTVTPAAQGALSATISLVAPTTDIAGNALSSISKIELKRGNAVIHTFSNPAPGATLTYTDNGPVNGNNTYYATPYNDQGFGEEVSATAYIGLDVPTRPVGGTIDDQQSQIVLSWNPVGGTGLNGGYVDPSRVHYNIYSVADGIIDTQLATTADGETTVTLTLDTEAGNQALNQYAIAAVNEAGRSDIGTAALVVGQTYRLPFVEHFSGSATQNYWYRYGTAGITPSFASQSSDGDGSSYLLQSEVAGAQAEFITGKISLRGATNPRLLFDHNGLAGSNSSLTIEIVKPDGSYDSGLFTYNYRNQSSTDEWLSEAVSLDAYKNERYIEVAFWFASTAAGQHFNLDNVRVQNVDEYDLSVALSAPSIVRKGSTADVAVTVKNEGSVAADEYRVKLLANGTEVYNERVTEALASQASRVFNVEYNVPAVTDDESLSLQAVVEFDYDLNEDNNTATAAVTIKGSNLPTVENLQGSENGNDIVLTWNQPSNLSVTYTEEFEGDEFPAFSNGGISTTVNEGTLGEWKVVDRDGAETYRLSSQVLFPTDGLQNAWYVLEPGLVIDLSINQRVRPHSGDRYLMAMGAADRSSDDWLISPRLSGEEQEISFWTSCFSASFEPEKFELYYSTTGSNILNMTYFGQGSLKEEKWTEQKFTVPAGTRYFAIRHTSNDSWGLMLDDVTYRVGASSIAHYNIYRDGTLIGSVDALDALTYTDSNVTSGHNYYVTVVFSDGQESDAIGVIVGEPAGIENVNANLNVSRNGNVYDLQGRKVNADKLSKGIYIINGRKVAVK